MDVQQTPTLPTVGQSTTPPAAPAEPVISSDFETFLVMLTTQLENQDPLNPIESADFAVQLATFSGVEQQVQTNDLLKSLSAQLGVNEMTQYSSWVGKEVRSSGPIAFDGSPVTIIPAPNLSADRAELVVKDENGRILATMGIALSNDPIEWTGILPGGTRLPEGRYRLEVESYINDALDQSTPIEAFARVTEVRSENGAVTLVTAGGQAVSPASVTALRDPLG